MRGPRYCECAFPFEAQHRAGYCGRCLCRLEPEPPAACDDCGRDLVGPHEGDLWCPSCTSLATSSAFDEERPS